jgi:hypothetical protein
MVYEHHEPTLFGMDIPDHTSMRIVGGSLENSEFGKQ